MKILTFECLAVDKGINYSRDHLRRLVKAGKFPQPVRLSAARIAWREEEIDGWLDGLTSGSDR